MLITFFLFSVSFVGYFRSSNIKLYNCGAGSCGHSRKISYKTFFLVDHFISNKPTFVL